MFVSTKPNHLKEQKMNPEKEKNEIITGIKAFDKDLKCRDMQYELGKEFSTDNPNPEACKGGALHFCKNPLDVLRYYSPISSRFAEVEARGKSALHHEDSKVATNKLYIKDEITLHTLIGMSVKFVMNLVNFDKDKQHETGDSGNAAASGDSGNAAASGNWGNAAASGDSGNAAASGEYSNAITSGFYGLSEATGDQSLAIAAGPQNKAKGKKGSWLVCSQWKQDQDGSWVRADVRVAKVDGEYIKEDVYYRLEDGVMIADI